jgi:hypothetical protein
MAEALVVIGMMGALAFVVAGIETALFRRVPDGTGALMLRTKPVPVFALRVSITSRKEVA